MTKSDHGERRRITLERTYASPIEDVWALWTTREGLESWWGPDGFVTQVRKLDLRPGGELVYAMIATAPEMVEFMKRSGMPTSQECRARYVDVVEHRRIEYVQWVDFVPDVQAYDARTLVELEATDAGVRMVISLDAMHDELWTQRAVMGWESQLGRLERRLAARAAS
jgi:uncharacterized protein YndB with AHSA1/START domain